MGCDQRVGSAERVAGVAGPGIVGRVGDHPCANGIELDVTQALQEVCFGIDSETGVRVPFFRLGVFRGRRETGKSGMIHFGLVAAFVKIQP
jgi:hypothetical protein